MPSMRSILKHPHLSDPEYHQQCLQPFPFATCATVEVSPRVHFPPTPTLTSIFITHSSAAYDRTPAEVLPNTCALPGRHEREFVDMPQCSRRTRRPMWDEGSQNGYFHPRASSSETAESSESDDSDAVRTPPDPTLPGHSIAVRFGYRNMGDAMLPYPPTEDEIQSALLLLPHESSMMSKKVARRSHSLGRAGPKELRRQSADGRIQHHHSEFAVPTLDFEGCLGGF